MRVRLRGGVVGGDCGAAAVKMGVYLVDEVFFIHGFGRERGSELGFMGQDALGNGEMLADFGDGRFRLREFAVIDGGWRIGRLGSGLHEFVLCFQAFDLRFEHCLLTLGAYECFLGGEE